MTFTTSHATGLFCPQIAATLAITEYGTQVANQAQEWKVKSTTLSTNELAPKKKRTAGGSNLMPEIEHLLASRSNWYQIDSTPQYQYPGVFPPENPDSPPPELKRMGHMWIAANYHSLQKETHTSFITKTSSQKVTTVTMSEKLLLMATSRTFAFAMQRVKVCSSVKPPTAPLRAQKKPKNVRLIPCHS